MTRKKKQAPRADEGAAMLQAVYEQLDEEGPRLVYGDWLQERGDPRGELIVLQCSKKRTGEQERRGAELLARHGAAWLGPLAEILDDETLEFRRGFPARATVKKVARGKVVKAVGALEWSTVEELSFVGTMGGAAVKTGAVILGPRIPAARLLLDPAMRSLRVVRDIDGHVLVALSTGERDLSLEEVAASVSELMARTSDLRSWAVDDAARLVLARCARLPKLRRLTLQAYPGELPDLTWLFTGELIGRLDELRLDNWGGDLGHYVAAAQHKTSLSRLVVRRREYDRDDSDDWVYWLERGRDRQLSSLRVELRGRELEEWLVEQLVADLKAVEPGALSKVVIATVPSIGDEDHALLRKTTLRFPRVKKLELERLE